MSEQKQVTGQTVQRGDQVYRLLGHALTIPQEVPHFVLSDSNQQTITDQSLSGQVTIVSVVPDINTSVCDLQTRTFHQQASQIPDVRLVTVAKNSPQQFQDWCAAKGLDMEMWCDETLNFGYATGLIVETFDLLARAVLVVDATGTIVYREIVPVLSDEPNYQAALDAAREAVKL